MKKLTDKIVSDNKDPKLTKKQKAIDILFKPNKDGVSDWISKEEIDKNNELKWGNNGIMRRRLFHNDNRYIWDTERKNGNPSGQIIAIRTIGINEELLAGKNRPIRADIRKYHNSMGCVVCGSHSDLITDHKNDLYNDPRVLDTKTQIKEDFQCLCNHCNLQKREIAKKTKEQKIYSVVGGGDTIKVINQINLFNNYNFVSTAGGAFLEYLEGKNLPGIKALN